MRAILGAKRRAIAVALAAQVLALGCQRSNSPLSQPGAAPTRTDSATRTADSTDDPANVLRIYYRAINERRYDDAYRLWVSSGAASGKSLEAFRSGFANTASAHVVLGTPGSIEGAAGSRYIEIPVQVSAVASEGGRQAFIGTYTLRRSVVDGATSDQRAWRIYSAKIQRAGP